MERLVFVGPGRAGLSLGAALHESDETLSLTYFGRRPEPPEHPLFHEGLAEYHYGLRPIEAGTTAVFLTVPDAALAAVAVGLAEQGRAPAAGCAAFHCSGALGADVLAPLNASGYAVGTLHPLQSLADPLSGPEHFQGTYFAVSGAGEALAIGRRLVSLLGGRTLTVPTSRRPLYHAAAVMASNYLVVLLDGAARALSEAGATPEEAEQAILALARGTLDNVSQLGVAPALTGPLVRGDVETVGLHLRSLKPEEARLYAIMGLSALEAFRESVPSEAARRMADLFERHA